MTIISWNVKTNIGSQRSLFSAWVSKISTRQCIKSYNLLCSYHSCFQNKELFHDSCFILYPQIKSNILTLKKMKIEFKVQLATHLCTPGKPNKIRRLLKCGYWLTQGTTFNWISALSNDQYYPAESPENTKYLLSVGPTMIGYWHPLTWAGWVNQLMQVAHRSRCLHVYNVIMYRSHMMRNLDTTRLRGTHTHQHITGYI